MAQSYLRTNFRVGQSGIVLGALTSHVAAISTSGTTDASGFLTTSMGGLGAPSMWIAAVIMSVPAHATFATGAAWLITPTQSFSGSIGWIVIYASGIAASLASVRALTTALIGSVS